MTGHTQPTPDQAEIVTVQEAAGMLGVSRQALYARIRSGSIPSEVAPTGQEVIMKAELRRWRKVRGRLVRQPE